MPRKNRRSLAQKRRHAQLREQRLRGEASPLDADNQPVAGDAEISVRASFSQSDQMFSEYSRGSQCLTNSLMFLVHLHETELIFQADLDQVLRTGDRLYCEIRRSLEASERFVSRDLSFDDVPESVVTEQGCYKVVKSSPVNGLLLQDAPEGWEKFLNLSLRVEALGTAYSHALLIVGGLCVSVFRDRLGRYGFFDPHARNADGTCAEENGKAVMVTFQAVTDLTKRLLQLFTGSLNFDADKEYNLLPLCFERVTCLSTVPCGQQPPYFELGNLLKLGKLRRRKIAKRLQRKQQQQQQALNGQQDVTKMERAQRKRDAGRERYRLHSAQKQAAIRIRYWSDPDYRMRQQLYMRNRYRYDPCFKQRQKKYTRDRYRNDPSYKQRKKLTSKMQYLKKKENKNVSTETQTLELAALNSMTCSGLVTHEYGLTPCCFSEERPLEPVTHEAHSLYTQDVPHGPGHVCTMCHRSLLPGQASLPESSADSPLTSTSFTGTYVHVCGDECAEQGVCVMPKQKEEWICKSCHENIIVFTV